MRRLLGMTMGRFGTRNLTELRRAHDESDARRIAAYDAVLQSHGATVRRPFTVTQLALVLTALRDGLHLRRLVDPAVIPDSLYGDTALALAIATLDTRHRHEHIDEACAALESPAPGAGASRPTLPDDPRQAVIDTAATEFAEHSFFLTPLEGIAESSGVPIDMLTRLFPTKAHIVIAALRPRFEAAAQGGSPTMSPSGGGDHVTVIRRHLIRCARLTVEERPFMDAMITSVSHDTAGFAQGTLQITEELHFPSLIEPVIADGQRHGLFSADQPSAEFAAVLTNALFIRCFSRRTHSPEENALIVAELILDGLRIRPTLEGDPGDAHRERE